MQITKAMKMVSASKLRRATDKIVQIRPYANQLNEVLTNIVSNLQGELNLSLAENREIKKVLIVVVTGDKGLCGGFNANVIKLAKNLINEKYAQLNAQGGVELLFVGKKGVDGFKAFTGYKNITYSNILGKLSFETAAEVATEVVASFERGEYDRVEVVYNMFKNAAVQIPTAEQFLPVQTSTSEQGTASADYIFEPGDRKSVV